MSDLNGKFDMGGDNEGKNTADSIVEGMDEVLDVIQDSRVVEGMAVIRDTAMAAHAGLAPFIDQLAERDFASATREVAWFAQSVKQLIDVGVPAEAAIEVVDNLRPNVGLAVPDGVTEKLIGVLQPILASLLAPSPSPSAPPPFIPEQPHSGPVKLRPINGPAEVMVDPDYVAYAYLVTGRGTPHVRVDRLTYDGTLGPGEAQFEDTP